MSDTDPASSPIPHKSNLQLFQRTPLKESRTPFTPDVILLEASDRTRYVLKDFSRKPWLARIGWCRFAVKRETEAYRLLDGIAGIPRLIAILGPDAFVMQWLDGTPLPRRKQRDTLGDGFFDRLETAVAQMHSRGVAHGDLRRKNILRGADGQPCIIDFETAILRDRPLRRALFKTISRIDRITILKIRAKYYPDQVTDAERAQLEDVPWHLKAGRFLRQKVYGSLTHKRAQRQEKRRRRANK